MKCTEIKVQFCLFNAEINDWCTLKFSLKLNKISLACWFSPGVEGVFPGSNLTKILCLKYVLQSADFELIFRCKVYLVTVYQLTET